MKKGFLLTLIVGICITFSGTLDAQVKLSATLGGGFSDLSRYFDDTEEFELLNGHILLELGGAVSGTFVKGGKLGWSSKVLLQFDGFKNIPVDYEALKTERLKYQHILENGLVIYEIDGTFRYPRDYNNVFQQKNWSVNLPISLTLNVFDAVGLIMGVDLHYSLTKFDQANRLKISGVVKEVVHFEDFNLGGHLGFFVPIGQRFQIEGRVFSDFETRLKLTNFDNRGYYRVGAAMSVNYQLN